MSGNNDELFILVLPFLWTILISGISKDKLTTENFWNTQPQLKYSNYDQKVQK